MEKEIYALKTQIAFERELLKTWREGKDLSLMPPNWDTDKQLWFIKGIKHALEIIKEEQNF